MLSRESRLRDVFEMHVVPHCLEDPDSRNVEGYLRALAYWEALTKNATLAELDGSTLAMSEFKSALARATWCRSCLSADGATRIDCGCPSAKPLSPNSQAKYLDHVQWMLDQCGPRGQRKLRSALGLIGEVPYTRPPKRRRTYKPAARWCDVLEVWDVLHRARIPTAAQPAPDLWRALFEVLRCTSLRYSQLMRLPWAAVDLAERMIVLPAALCPKSKADEPHPISPAAVRRLLVIRSDAPLVFGAFAAHSKSTIYSELRRLRRLAGAPWFGFHSVRAAVITELSRVSPAAGQMAAGHSSYATTKLYQDVAILADAVATMPSMEELRQTS